MSFPYIKYIYAIGIDVRSVDLNAIQDVLVDMNGATWQPTMVGVSVGDMSVRKGWWMRAGGLVHIGINITWNNTNGGTAGDPVTVNLPWQAADYSGGGGPAVSSNPIDPISSIWTNKGTDRGAIGAVSHLAGFATMTFSRQSTANASPGLLTNDTGVARQIWCDIRYITDGVKLI